jgi:hypothetical protein
MLKLLVSASRSKIQYLGKNTSRLHIIRNLYRVGQMPEKIQRKNNIALTYISCIIRRTEIMSRERFESIRGSHAAKPPLQTPGHSGRNKPSWLPYYYYLTLLLPYYYYYLISIPSRVIVSFEFCAANSASQMWILI